jgi:hypothetical protein
MFIRLTKIVAYQYRRAMKVNRPAKMLAGGRGLPAFAGA